MCTVWVRVVPAAHATPQHSFHRQIPRRHNPCSDDPSIRIKLGPFKAMARIGVRIGFGSALVGSILKATCRMMITSDKLQMSTNNFEFHCKSSLVGSGCYSLFLPSFC